MNRYEFSGWNRFGWKVSSTIYAADLETAAQIFDGELRKTEALR